MARTISFLALVGFVLVFGLLFYKVVAPFLLPLFLAGVLAILFRPWHANLTRWSGGRRRLAAGVTTFAVALVVLVPFSIVLTTATVELLFLVPQDFLKSALSSPSEQAPAEPMLPSTILSFSRRNDAEPSPSDAGKKPTTPDVRKPSQPKTDDGKDQRSPNGSAAKPAIDMDLEKSNVEASANGDEAKQTLDTDQATTKEPPGPPKRSLRDKLLDRIQKHVPFDQDDRGRINDFIDKGFENVAGFVAARTVGLLGGLVGGVIGMVITVVALYFFFADGPAMIETLQRLTPLEDRHERELMQQFDAVCRAIVFATIASASVQGALAGLGFAIAGLRQQVFLLSIVTTFFAMVPFLGAAAVWIPVSIALALQEQWTAAIFVFLYGLFVVSLVDNLIKPLILHGRAGMHPLLALLSVLGGVRALGLWGIFIGPMVAALLHALLNILHKELKVYAEVERRSEPPPKPATASAPPPPADGPALKTGKSEGTPPAPSAGILGSASPQTPPPTTGVVLD